MLRHAWIPLLLILTTLAACDPAAPSVPAPSPLPLTEAPSAAPPTDAPSAVPPTETSSAVPPTEAPTSVPTGMPPAAVLCPDVPRPALLLFNGLGYELTNPRGGERCPVPLPAEALGPQVVAGGRLYLLQRDPDAAASVISRLNPDGTLEPLPATRTEGDTHYLTQFTVAPDESRLAWSQMRPPADPTTPGLLSTLWIGTPATAAGDAVVVFADQIGGQYHIATPIRFSADGGTLFFTWQPIGLGGAWVSFNGRYDTLYRLPATGGPLEKIFDCAERAQLLCIGDFRDDGTLAYSDADQTIHVIGPDGAELAAIPSTEDYSGYPTFNASGDLFYHTAVLSEDGQGPPTAAPGTIYRVAAPYTGEPAVVARAPGLMPPAGPQPFLDADHLVAGYAPGLSWGQALVGPDGAILPIEPPNASIMTVWPEGW